MHRTVEKILLIIFILGIAVGYFVGSWFLIEYGIQQNNLKIIASPLLVFMAIIMGFGTILSFRSMFRSQRMEYGPLDNRWVN